jgi:hypothetical protein
MPEVAAPIVVAYLTSFPDHQRRVYFALLDYFLLPYFHPDSTESAVMFQTFDLILKRLDPMLATFLEKANYSSTLFLLEWLTTFFRSFPVEDV